MLNRLRAFIRTIPTLLLAFAMAVAIWIIAITASDPVEVRDYSQPIPIETISLDSDLLITNMDPSSVQLRISAPHSIWIDLETRSQPIHAVVDLSGLGEGTHMVPIQIQVEVKPVDVQPFSPSEFKITLEELVSRDFPIQVNITGTPAVGFKVENPVLEPSMVTVSGPKSLVSAIQQVLVTLPIQNVRENITSTSELVAVDADNQTISGVDFSTTQIQVNAEVTPLYGYRNVAVKAVWSGSPAVSYQLTGITTNPPAVIVFSQNALLVENLPGYIETVPIDLTNVKASFSKMVKLNIPLGITVLDQTSVEVNVGVQPLRGNITLNDIPVRIDGLAVGYTVKVSPSKVTVILTGPLADLNTVTAQDVLVTIDLTGVSTGRYQKVPRVVVANANISLVSVVPESLSIEVIPGKTPTP
jgi:YbbR domain-containing protein